MSTNAVIEVNTQDADRCNRQAHVVTYGTHVKFGPCTLVLGSPSGRDAYGFDTYEINFVGDLGSEKTLLSSAFVAAYFLEQSLLNKAATMAKATGSVGATAIEDYRDASGKIVVLGIATWKRS